MPEKSAEEWIDGCSSNILRRASNDSATRDFINAVKRNAKHAAMLEAAEIAEQMQISTEKHYGVAESVGADKSKRAILTAAKKYED